MGEGDRAPDINVLLYTSNTIYISSGISHIRVVVVISRQVIVRAYSKPVLLRRFP